MPRMTRERSQCLFNVMDASGDGRLSFEELRRGMTKMREMGVEGSASSFWDEANEDGNPVLDADEFHALMTKLSMSMAECAKLNDTEWLGRMLREGGHPVNEQQAGGSGYAPLHWAATNDCTEAALLLLGHGARPDIATADGTTPLHLAAVHDQLSAAGALLAHGATAEHANAVGDTALHLAAANNATGVLGRLLEGGVAPSFLEAKTIAGSTALHKAAAYGHLGTVRLLIQAGAYLDQVDNAQDTPMHDASARAYGVTPLHAAALKGHADCVRLLLTSGANPEARDGRDLTPAAVARSSDQPRVVRVLRQWKHQGKDALATWAAEIEKEEREERDLREAKARRRRLRTQLRQTHDMALEVPETLVGRRVAVQLEPGASEFSPHGWSGATVVAYSETVRKHQVRFDAGGAENWYFLHRESFRLLPEGRAREHELDLTHPDFAACDSQFL